MFSIYRKPMATDIIIPNDSCHPPEHKLAAIRYLTNCLSTYPMNETEKRKGNYTMKQIIYTNKSSLVFSPKAGYGRNQSPVRRPVWLWHTAF